MLYLCTINFNQRVADAKAAKYTTAAQDLINMDAERKFVKWSRDFAVVYSQYGVSENGTVYRGNEHYSDDVEKNKDLLILSEEDILYTWKYLDEPASPCSAAFWEESILSPGLNPFEKNSYNADLLAIPSALEDENLIKAYLEFMTHEDCKNVIREYLAEKQRIGQQLATQGEQTYKNIGFPGNDVIRKELEAASK